ncbi:MAG: hypothetical protein IPP57_26745 [Candidatus Obscuribacter sp.]|nr:hypothetical protein [Candidatus Obscuribacter sp.]
MHKASLVAIPLVAAIFLSGCSNASDPANASSKLPVREMQPLQPDQPPQKPERSFSTVPAVQGGNPGTTPMPFTQPFLLGDMEYQFIGVKAKEFVGLEAKPSKVPPQGFYYFVVRYQVISHAKANVTVPNYAAVHLVNQTNQQVSDIDVDATNANIQSGAATGLPDQLVLEPEKSQIQTLVFQIPLAITPQQIAILVNDPANPEQVFQSVTYQ